MEQQLVATQQLHVRYISGSLNAYLMAVAEMGALGVITLLIDFYGMILAGIRAISLARGAARLATTG